MILFPQYPHSALQFSIDELTRQWFLIERGVNELSTDGRTITKAPVTHIVDHFGSVHDARKAMLALNAHDARQRLSNTGKNQRRFRRALTGSLPSRDTAGIPEPYYTAAAAQSAYQALSDATDVPEIDAWSIPDLGDLFSLVHEAATEV